MIRCLYPNSESMCQHRQGHVTAGGVEGFALHGHFFPICGGAAATDGEKEDLSGPAAPKPPLTGL